ncbi:clathrin light chain [Thermoascus aurantiacus ATCC 26904]
MADRFPSLEEFSAGQTEVVDTNGTPDAEDFLARERALLGEDADQFATPNDHITASAAVGDLNDDLLGGGDDAQPAAVTTSDEVSGFESSFPAIEPTQNQQVGPGGTITGTGAPFPPTGYTNYQAPEEEPEAVRQWRERRDADLRRRAEISAEKKAALIKKAQQDIDDFYVSYGNKADKGRAQARAEAEQFLANRDNTAAGGTSWERIAKLVDVSGKGAKGGASGSGKERFRELLLDLKKDPNAPGASGV